MTTKRKALTTDDLMRLQEEGLSRKRPRQNAVLLDLDDSDVEMLPLCDDTRPVFTRQFTLDFGSTKVPSGEAIPIAEYIGSVFTTLT